MYEKIILAVLLLYLKLFVDFYYYTKYFLIYQYPNYFFYSKFVHNFVGKLM